MAQHIQDRNGPILTMTTQPAIPNAVFRPLVEPVALFPWSMIWNADTRHPGLHALHQAAEEMAATHDWLGMPDGAWLPEPEASLPAGRRPQLPA
jgi:hypothetical protein